MSDAPLLPAMAQNFSAWHRVRIILWALLRVAIGFATIVLIMSLAPDEPSKSAWYSVTLVTILITGYGAYSWYQLRSVKRARFPTVRAMEALILIAAMFLAVFSIAYLLLSRAYPGAFTEELTGFTSYYFSLTVLATVGFGDITPKTVPARAVTMVQMALDLVFVAVLLRIVLGAARRALSDRLSPSGSDES